MKWSLQSEEDYPKILGKHAQKNHGLRHSSEQRKHPPEPQHTPLKTPETENRGLIRILASLNKVHSME